MGLCKCPKKKVTNQFCFEHRVNVCEHCIVADHTKCVVQSYLQWLNDSEYDPKCALCKDPLDTQNCTRLVCYDVFHSSCLERWGSSHPPHTAPAGFQCPVCRAAVFPAPQVASPVALALKQTLTTWQWARKAMGLPASGGDEWSSRNGATTAISDSTAGTASSPSEGPNIPTHTFTSNHNNDTTKSTPQPAPPSTAAATASHYNSGSAASSAAGVGPVTGVAEQHLSSTYRKGSSSDSHSLNVVDESDTDDNKYKRRPAITWFKRWWRSYQPLGNSSGRGVGRRRMVALLCVILLATVLLLLARARSRPPGEESALESMFDPLNNPNIHVQDG